MSHTGDKADSGTADQETELTWGQQTQRLRHTTNSAHKDRGTEKLKAQRQSRPREADREYSRSRKTDAGKEQTQAQKNQGQSRLRDSIPRDRADE